jgi:hypothetical protein
MGRGAELQGGDCISEGLAKTVDVRSSLSNNTSNERAAHAGL